jgi:diaminopropionate ammonia-lyase
MTSINIKKETMMAGLSCGEPSLLGWEILCTGTDDFITIDDSSIPELMRLLAQNNPRIEAGESSVAGLAGLIGAMENQKVAEMIGLNKESIVLLFGTEGATDLEIYNSIVSE